MKAVIMAGGKGTRLRSVTVDVPKPMIPINGKPILEYQIESLKRSNIESITLVVGHLKEIVKEYFGDGKKLGVQIEYIEEREPLGTAGALYYLKQEKEDFLLLFGDLVLDIDFERFMRFHKDRQALITLFGHPNSHPFDSDIIITDEEKRVKTILGKNEQRPFYYHNFVNAGIYCINPKALNCLTVPEKKDLEKDVIVRFIGEGRVFAYKSTEYVKDMGTAERLEAVSTDISRGIVFRRNLRQKQQAIFLDRDGTVNEHVGFLRDIRQFRLIPKVEDAIVNINKSVYLAIVATNQPVVARGEASIRQLEDIHKRMETELGENGAYLDDILYCPHHPDRGFAGEIPELKIKCECRKPKIGMLLEAASRYNISLKDSWYIGDTTIDLQTGINAGMRTILVMTGEAGNDGKYKVFADYIADNLNDAVQYIIDQEGLHENME